MPYDEQPNVHLVGLEHRQKMLEDLYEVMGSCSKCEELNQSGSNWGDSTLVVFGAGDCDADIMLVGISACRPCQRSGYPFTKGSGEILDDCLDSIGLGRTDVFISNLIHCHPPNNRKPTEEEIDNCKDYLLSEIKIVDPEVIVPLGTQPVNFFLPDMDKISDVHARAMKVFIKRRVYKLFPFKHPAWAMRQGSVTDQYVEEFGKVEEVVSA